MAKEVTDASIFIMQYPGVYPNETVKAAMDKYYGMLEEIGSTTVSTDDLIAGKVKAPKLIGSVKVTEEMLRFNAYKYAPEYEPMMNADIAKQFGYKDIFAMITFGACDDSNTQPTPPEARDTLLVSQIFHEIENFEPIYPGDTLYMVRDRVDVKDLTPVEGSIYRHLYQKDYGTTYNQDGKIVCKCCFSTMESVKIYKEEFLPKPRKEMGFPDFWEAPDWTNRPALIYTDNDYENLKEIWRNESIRGAEPMYWEDINIGDKANPSAYGPIMESVTPLQPYGQGIAGVRCLKHDILDSEKAAKLIRDEKTGVLMSPIHEENFPETPDGLKGSPQPEGMPGGESVEGNVIDTADIHKAGPNRSALINLITRDIALGHVMNYIGYTGKIRKIKWGIMPSDTHSAMNHPVPYSGDFEVFTRRIRGMENSGITVHGLTTDVAIIKSEVTDKYVVNGRHMVDIVFWAETYNTHEIWITGMVEVELPTK
ncbi:MAG: hypothetical protein HUJ76_06305 [Parasporobacterium sp.]|nr:hypothetical protein [Parasporobacterium sp.]